MKRILITGKNSYVGTSFKNYMEQYSEYYVEELDLLENEWTSFDFSSFDTVFHVAGIAHMKEKKENKELYYEVNRDLTYAVAKKAKESKIKHFIFMSSMSVYGLIYSNVPINRNTIPKPNTFYGESKLEAEQLISDLVDDTFKICILRPPMVYGENSPGNFSKLSKAVSKVRVFPKFNNQRSIISVDDLVCFVKNYIDGEKSGIYAPKSDKNMNTYEFIRHNMDSQGVNVWYPTLFNWIIKILIGKNITVTKVFGDLIYEW